MNKLRNSLLTLAFACIILSSSGILATGAYAQLSTSGLSLGGIGSTIGNVGSTAIPGGQTLSGTTSQTVNNIIGLQKITLNNVQSTSGVTDSSNQITISGFNAGTGNNQLLLVGISPDQHGVVSVTFGGAPLTKAVSSWQNNDAELWYLKNPTGNGDIVATMAGPTQAVIGAYSFSNVDQSNPVLTTATNYGTGSPTVSIITKFPGDWVVDAASIFGGSTLGSPTCTQEWNDNIPDVITGASSAREAAFPAIVTCNWTASSPDNWDDVAVELKAEGTSLPGINVGTTAIKTSSSSLPGISIGVVPTPPTNLAANAVSNSQIDLSWTAPSGGTGDLLVTGYKIERSLDNGNTWSTIASNTGSTATTYSDTGLSTDTTYTYRVSAINLIGASAPSSTASATTQNNPTATAPDSPTGLVASAGDAQVSLSWNVPSNDGGAAITGYNVYRGTTSNGEDSTPIATGVTSTSYTDTGLTNGQTYFYTVTAVNSVGESGQSNEASATPTSPSTSGGITVYAHRIPASYWDPCFAATCSAGTGPGVTMYFVLYDSSGNVVQTGFADENGYTFSGLSSSATYYVYPDDCDNCHGAPHDVAFQYWGDDHTNERPRAATVGAQLHAWYSCTNNCSGGP